MRQIVYISTANANLLDTDIGNIMEASLRNNPRRDITGFLLFNGRNFLQLVEGPEESLDGLMADLGLDPRHGGIVLLENNAITQRSCDDWAMKRLTLADSVSTKQAALKQHLPDSLDDRVKRTIQNFAALN